MKKGLDKAGLKKHLMIQPIGYLTPVLGKEGFTSLAEFPYGMFVRREELTKQESKTVWTPRENVCACTSFRGFSRGRVLEYIEYRIYIYLTFRGLSIASVV